MRQIYADYNKGRIVMTRKFAEKAEDPTTHEYAMLHKVMSDNPTLRVETHTIRRNPNKECYKGLTYEYMGDYILTHLEGSERDSALAELREQLFLSKCHTIKYPSVKKWFLEKFKEVDEMYGTAKVAKAPKKVVGIPNMLDHAA